MNSDADVLVDVSYDDFLRGFHVIWDTGAHQPVLTAATPLLDWDSYLFLQYQPLRFDDARGVLL